MRFTAARYASALRDVSTNLAEYRSAIEGLERIAHAMAADAHIRAFLCGKGVPAAQRMQVIQQAIGKTAPAALTAFLHTLLANGQLGSIANIALAAQRLADT